ncbi:MAG: DUF523 domain-containing protein [Clostridiales bacterium]|nr:DUF523 domain-containing protein [Clostridiales bacterium]MCF8022301.1 DUF523 domain-containing protein [Clostridiales bacterium]
MILVSACLLGYNCKYSGSNNLRNELVEMQDNHILIPVCPEVMGGLPTPRPPAQFDRADGSSVLKGKAKIINCYGRDVTGYFIRGADIALRIAIDYNIKTAILKERSPSCGSSFVYITEKGEKPVEGKGVAAALLEKNGLHIYSDQKFFKS